MLVWITFTHLPTVLSTYVNQPLGFFAATEGFIFLSALFTGRIYFQHCRARRPPRHVPQAVAANRAAVLLPVVAAGFAFFVEAPIAAHGNRPAVHNLLDYYFTAGRTHAFVDAAFMIYRPPLLDILPIYIIFLALTPIALILASRLGWKSVLAGSSVVWLLAQFGFRGFVYHWLIRAFHLRIPLNQMGAFNLWAWQLWWLVGDLAGRSLGKEQLASRILGKTDDAPCRHRSVLRSWCCAMCRWRKLPHSEALASC